MADRKVLIVTYHFPPSAASGTFRILGFVHHLPPLGWECVVVAPPSLPWEPTDEALLERVPAETAVHRISFRKGGLWKPVGKLFPWGSWLPFATVGCYRALRDHRPDAVLTSGPPHVVHLLGRHLHRWTGLPWVADFRDPWVAGDPSQTRRNVPVWEARAEASVMREATAIVVNTPGAGDFLRETYPQYATKITSITNGYDPDRFDANPIPPFSGSTIEIVHTGEIYANRSPVPFLDAVQLLDAAALGGRALRVRFIGGFQFEKQKKETEERIRRGLHGSVFLEGQVPYSQSIQAMVQADLLLLLDTPGRRAGVPAKLFEYIGAGRPVLALAEPEGDVAWVLKVSGIPHRIASPVDRGAIRLALVDLLNDPATRRCCNQDKLLPPRFTRERLAGDLAALLDSCLGTSSVMVVDGSLPEVVTR